MDNPTIEWVYKSGVLCLKFTFTEDFSENDAKNASIQWQEALAARPHERIIHIWDCLEMTDYDQEAKKIWIEKCKALRLQIDTIWLISDSLLINMGARIISLMTYLDIRVVQSEQKIRF